MGRFRKGGHLMLTYVLIALLITFFRRLFYFETIKVKLAFDRIQRINMRIEKKILNMLKENKRSQYIFY